MLPLNQARNQPDIYPAESGNFGNLLYENEQEKAPHTTKHLLDAQESRDAIEIIIMHTFAVFKIQMTPLLPSPAPPPRRHYTT